MTGTSCDGLDASCLEFNARGEWRALWEASVPYDPALRRRVLGMQKVGDRFALDEVLALHRDLGDWYGREVSRLVKRNAKRGAPDLIASHGQTIAHFPDEQTTLQLGDPSRIAARAGLSVATFFREGDLAAGGQGAPLLPLFHARIAEEFLGRSNGVAFLNLGGIANLTYLGPGGKVLAFDTGPANFWIDECVEEFTRGQRKFDRGGQLARAGEVDWFAVERVLKHPYFKRQAPKSTGRGDFPLAYLKRATRARGKDLIATATAVTVESVARAFEDFLRRHRQYPLTNIYVCGGGARNPTLMAWLQARMAPIAVADVSRLGLNPQAIESQGFAYFGFLAATGQPVGGAWTGVRSFGPPAHLVPGENWTELAVKVAKLAQSG